MMEFMGLQFSLRLLYVFTRLSLVLWKSGGEPTCTSSFHFSITHLMPADFYLVRNSTFEFMLPPKGALRNSACYYRLKGIRGRGRFIARSP
jgi:hypothetical protein